MQIIPPRKVLSHNIHPPPPCVPPLDDHEWYLETLCIFSTNRVLHCFFTSHLRRSFSLLRLVSSSRQREHILWTLRS